MFKTNRANILSESDSGREPFSSFCEIRIRCIIGLILWFTTAQLSIASEIDPLRINISRIAQNESPAVLGKLVGKRHDNYKPERGVKDADLMVAITPKDILVNNQNVRNGNRFTFFDTKIAWAKMIPVGVPNIDSLLRPLTFIHHPSIKNSTGVTQKEFGGGGFPFISDYDFGFNIKSVANNTCPRPEKITLVSHEANILKLNTFRKGKVRLELRYGSIHRSVQSLPSKSARLKRLNQSDSYENQAKKSENSHSDLRLMVIFLQAAFVAVSWIGLAWFSAAKGAIPIERGDRHPIRYLIWIGSFLAMIALLFWPIMSVVSLE